MEQIPVRTLPQAKVGVWGSETRKTGRNLAADVVRCRTNGPPLMSVIFWDVGTSVSEAQAN